jgi:hypothetical protein
VVRALGGTFEVRRGRAESPGHPCGALATADALARCALVSLQLLQICQRLVACARCMADPANLVACMSAHELS